MSHCSAHAHLEDAMGDLADRTFVCAPKVTGEAFHLFSSPVRRTAVRDRPAPHSGHHDHTMRHCARAKVLTGRAAQTNPQKPPHFRPASGPQRQSNMGDTGDTRARHLSRSVAVADCLHFSLSFSRSRITWRSRPTWPPRAGSCHSRQWQRANATRGRTKRNKKAGKHNATGLAWTPAGRRPCRWPRARTGSRSAPPTSVTFMATAARPP